MGELINLDERRAARLAAASAAVPQFAFDVACPLSYLAAEHVERRLGPVHWLPVSLSVLRPEPEGSELDAIRRRAEATGRLLRLPLVWPDRFPAGAPRATRAVVRACELGAGGRFSLALMRLAFCGGFDIEDPEILAEAAAAADVGLQDCLEAAADPERDAAPAAAALRLQAAGLTELPAVGVGHRWFEGDRGLVAAASVLRSAAARRPLAPVG